MVFNRVRINQRNHINKIDEDVQAILLPLNILQYVIISPKYSIKNNTISSNNYIAKISTILCITFSSALYFYHAITMPSRITLFIKCIHYFDFFFYTIGYLINYTFNNIYSEFNIYCVLNLQNIIRSFKNIRIKRLIFQNWISVIFMVIIVITMFSLRRIYVPRLSDVDILYWLALICFDINMLYAIRFVNLLKYNAGLWNKRFKSKDSFDDNVCCDRKFKDYESIVECYKYFKLSFEPLVSISR